ncbi:unnamed protein product [Rhizopus stolonifer]
MNILAPINNSLIERQFTVYGIFGFIELLAGKEKRVWLDSKTYCRKGEYIIVITGCKKIGTLLEDIYQATHFEILSPRTMSENQSKDEQLYIPLLQRHLNSNTFYFSYKYNLTLSIQKQAELSAVNGTNDWRKADERFFWNKHLCTKKINASQKMRVGHDFSAFILPIIQGFISIHSTVINHRAVKFGLISRRSQERAGTRYFSRGLDELGNASNFVETEQILLCDDYHSLVEQQLLCFSHVQTRGSVPAIWRQIPNIRYTPQLWIHSDISQVIEASRAHFDQQLDYYGRQILVNLVNRKGYEYPIGELYARIVEQLKNPGLKYIHFDFHHECRKMKWNRVQVLIDQLEQDMREQGFCFYDLTSKPTLKQKQTSVVRTNCMDCLDRTNVVQSTLGRYILNRQLREAGILQSTEVIENDEQFMQIFKNMWADNADALSVSYSGTGALKTDFTRTGKRSYKGALNDLYNSVLRYLKNNYTDGSRQDGIDLILGKYRVTAMQPHSTPRLVKYSPIYLLLSVWVFLIILFNPQWVPVHLLRLLLLSFLFAIILASGSFIQQHGTECVDWPTLVPLSKTEDSCFSTVRRSSTDILNDREQGYEMPTLKKIT